MKRKSPGYWTKENCFWAALQCGSRSEFKLKYNQAWNICRIKGWLDEACSHMVRRTVKHGYWQNYENCYKAASHCVTSSEFERSYPQAYKVSKDKGWNKDYTWFKPGRLIASQKRIKWTYESCLEEAKKYTSISEFRKGSVGAYQRALRNRWLGDYSWFIKGTDIYGRPDCVYKYEFPDFKSIYIGRTINRGDRNYAHIFDIHHDVVARFAHEHDIAVPKMEVLADNLTLEEGQDLENQWKNFYLEQGYNVLNRGRTGKNKGSLGSIGWGKWTYETCFEEAKKYSSRKEFQKGNVSAYTRALQYKWLDDYFWFEKAKTGKIRWTQIRCYEEARKYLFREDFRKSSAVAYNKSVKRGWINDYTWLTKRPKKIRPTQSELYWTKERCYEEAKKYKSRTEFQYAKGANSAYKISVKNGWIDDYDWMKLKDKPDGYWNDYENCYEEAKKYKTRSEFQSAKGSSRAYRSAIENGWIDDYYWMPLKSKPRGYWTEERCMEESKKYKTPTDFRKGSASAYSISLRNGWYKNYTWLNSRKKK